MRWLLVVVALHVVGVPAQTVRASGSDPDAWVLCHDAARSVVRRMQRFRCQHEEVTKEEAERIRAARVERVRRSLDGGFQPPRPGLRLTGTGSSFFIDSRGRLLTNEHVVRRCTVVTVSPVSGDEVEASVERVDASADLALLKAPLGSSTWARFASKGAVTPQTPLSVVGYPARGRVAIRPTLITGRRHDVDGGDPDVLPLRMAVRSGHSGGPVLDDAARVVGVVFAAVNTPGIYARAGVRIRDVGLAVASGRVLRFLADGGVQLALAPEAPALDDRSRLSTARRFVAQVRCWR